MEPARIRQDGGCRGTELTPVSPAGSHPEDTFTGNLEGSRCVLRLNQAPGAFIGEKFEIIELKKGVLKSSYLCYDFPENDNTNKDINSKEV